MVIRAPAQTTTVHKIEKLRRGGGRLLMKRKTSTGGGGRTGEASTKKKKMKRSLAAHLTVQLGQISFKPPINKQSSSSSSSSISLPNPSRFQNLLDSEAQGAPESYPSSTMATTLDFIADVNSEDKDFILSQDFFCTPDYITPEAPPMPSSFTFDQEEIPCPKSPEKMKSAKSKRRRQGFELASDSLESDERIIEETAVEQPKNQGYVSQSAVALRCRVMPPPCMRNPYLKDSAENDIDPFGNCRSKCADFLSAFVGDEGLSRYWTDFHEMEQIGNGNFSRVFKVLKRIDGCMYAVKKSTRPLHQDNERRKALMEIQALASLGFHEYVVGYYTSWFENEQLYIQMELCDQSLSSVNQFHKLCPVGEVLEAMHQIAKALQFIHEKGVAHLDVKPENIYVKNGVYKLGDFGCATLLDKSLPIEEGDARYMPQEILNDNYDHLDKVDIFSLGATIYELVKGSTLPETGPHFMNLREGKLPLLPGHSVQFQNLLKAMMDPDPVRRPSAKELVENPIFERWQRSTTTK